LPLLLLQDNSGMRDGYVCFCIAPKRRCCQFGKNSLEKIARLNKELT
jgi:hypothetical protein